MIYIRLYYSRDILKKNNNCHNIYKIQNDPCVRKLLKNVNNYSKVHD